jgi:hypothetical protein
MATFDPRRETDLDWAAFRYVSGELVDADRLAFEDRLEHDQAAREAVAAAVELAGAIRLVGGEPPIVARRTRHPLFWGLGAAIAAGLLLWLVPAWLATHHGQAGNEVALAWSDLRGQVEQAGEVVEDEAIGDEVEEEAAQDVPDWMIEVVTEPSFGPEVLPGR